MININNYKVYVHVFPDGKRYVGCTSIDLRSRWDTGMGYASQPKVFDAIVKFGWDNIRHYMLHDNLTKKEAELLEAAYINKWKTYTPCGGYNKRRVKIKESDSIDVLSFSKTSKIKIEDPCITPVLDRYHRRYTSDSKIKSKKVRCIETGEIFENAEQAAMMHGSGRAESIYQAIRNHWAHGYCEIFDEECGTYCVKAHWEYVNEN